MKYIVIVGDGMSDLPIKELNGKTPLEVANTKWMDFIAKEGKVGLLKTLMKGMPYSSETANLSILGYDPRKYYLGGRGPFEAKSLGINLKGNEIVIRINFITVENGILKHYSAENISTKESKILINELNKKFGIKNELKFYPGVGYRGVLILKNPIKNPNKYSEKLKFWPPHELKGKEIKRYFPKPLEKNAEKTAEILNEIIINSQKILSKSKVNKRRIQKGNLPANMIWFWSAGKYREIPKFKDKFKISGAIISAVSLIKGIGKAIGLSVIDVPNATASFDTNYKGKAEYALNALKDDDFVYIHVKAPDDLSHDGDVKRKIKAIELIDKEIVGRIIKKMQNLKYNFKIAILSDHTTSTQTGKHTPDPVPFAIYSSLNKNRRDLVKEFNENSATHGSYGLKQGTEFMKILLKNG
ncbi:cofactor-independent phosphoglycerate mutase [Candidatus Pacearchaeota archaeon]|nr:MAG: cofactor-independent phosphoglycerate mutase [Candidatus Pacearchaeota archaeon]